MCDTHTKVALYARVSKADATQDPENQLLRLRAYAKDRGWVVYSEYVDFRSGADANRPELRKMLKDAAAHRFSLVLCVKIDRIARSSLHLKQVITDLETRGIRFECTDQAFSTNTPEGRLLMGVLGEIAEFERSLIIERTRAGLARVKAEGRPLGRPRVRVDMDRVLELKAQGMGYRKIADVLGVSHQTVFDRLKREGVSGERKDGSDSPSQENGR